METINAEANIYQVDVSKAFAKLYQFPDIGQVLVTTDVCSHCGELLPTFSSANSSSLINPLMSHQCHIKQDRVTSNTSMGDQAHE